MSNMERLTERHSSVAVIKDKSKLKEAMEKLAAYEDAEEQKVRTNGDYIRSMNDEKLAEYIIQRSDNPMYEISDDVCECCSEWNKDDYCCDDDNCKKAIECWLRKEVENKNG